MALVKCKDCATEVSTSAKVCPKCGAPVVTSKKALGGCLTAIVGIGIFFAIMEVSKKEGAAVTAAVTENVVKGEPAANPTEQPRIVAIGDLLGAYKANELAADGQFKGHVIQTTGIVDEIGKTLGSAFVKVGTGAPFEIPALTCFLSDDATARAAQLAKGQRITVIGSITGLTMDVGARDCRIP